jgi:8-oxo-dGTP pyrophosphatase MutT (NUDIX family)
MNSAAILNENLSRTFLRRRLAASRTTKPRGDAATAARLLQAGGIQAFDPTKFTTVLAPGSPLPGRDEPHIPAAVLVPLVERAEGFTILFTQRTADLKSHAGQISFPGGRLEPADPDAVAGALRETAEEIGLDASHIEILGRLDPYVTVTGYEVTPVVGAVTPPFELKADPTEVADIFEVPLAFFLDPANHQRHSRVINAGIERAYYAIPYGDRYIWGATAGMLINLYEVLTAN